MILINFICMKEQTENTFWGRVRILIRAHKISQEKFASYTGINYYTLKSWLYYDRIPDIYTACDIADALGVSVNYLARGDNKKSLDDRAKTVRLRKTAAASIRKMAQKIREDAGLIG